MSSFNPKLAMSAYFDSLIRQIDIHTEQTLAKYADNDVFEFKSDDDKNKTENDDFIRDNSAEIGDIDIESFDSSLFDADFIWQSFFDENSHNFENNLYGDEQQKQQQEPMNVKNYVNKLRDEMIGELERDQEQAFILYESIKVELKRDIESLSDDADKRDHLFSRIFARKFYFTFIVRDSYYSRSWMKNPFKLHLVELDFYLNRNERSMLG